jgi:WD40 repeat protein
VFSPDARFIAGGGAGGKMFALWETESGKEVRQFQGHTDNVRCVAFSRDGKFLLSGGNDRTVRLWDVATGRLLKTFEGHTGAVRSVAFSADGRFGVSASDDRTAKIWKLEGDGGAAAPAPAGPLVATWQGHTAPVNCLALSPDGRTVVSGSYDNTVRLWDVVTGMEIKQFRGHEKGVRGVSFSADGKFIVSAGEDNLCKIWDVASGREARGIGSTNRWMLHASFSPDGKRLATATAGGAVRVWDNWLTATDPKSGKEFRGFTSPVYTVLFTPDGKHLLAASESGNAKLFDSDSAAELQNFRGQGGMYCAAMSADGKFVIAGSNSRSFKLWETASGREVRQFDGHADIVRALAFSRDGRFILSCADDKTVRLWETASGRLIKTFEGHTDKVRGVTFTADGRFGISGSADNTLKVWRLWDTDAPPQAAAPARPPMSELEEQIRYYVGNMGHPDVSKRIEASRELKKIGKPALPFLQPLTEDRDHSVRVAAAVLIATMREDDKPDATFPAGFGVKQTDRGLEIVAVTPNSAAEKIGLQRGDLITRFNNHEVKSAAQLQSSLAPDNINVSQSVLEVSRDGKPLNFQIPRR